MDVHQQLIQAVKENNSARIEELLKKGANVDARDKDCLTPLFLACCKGYVDICRRLLRWGCDVNAKGKAGATALMASADNCQVKCLTLLLQHRAINLDECSDRGDSALHMAAYRGFSEIVNLLVLAGSDIGLRNKNNNTPLAEAFMKDNTECIKILNEAQKQRQKSVNGGHHATNGQSHRYHRSQPHPRLNVSRSSIPRIDSEEHFVSSDSAIELSLPSSPGAYYSGSRSPECDDERSPPSGTSLKHNENGHDSISSHASNGHNDYRSQFSSVGREYDDSVLESSGSNSSSYGNLKGNTRNSTQNSIVSNGSPSIDSLYHSATPSCSTSFEETNASPTMYYPPVVEKDHVTTIYINKHGISANNNPAFVSRRKNDLSLQVGNIQNDKDVLQEYNILPEARDTKTEDATKTHLSNETSSQNNNTISKTLTLEGSEMIPGLKMSSFIENLQMRVLSLEESLIQERSSKNELRKENSKLKEDNMKLKVFIRNLTVRNSELSSQLSKKS